MARSSRKRRRSPLAAFLATSFVLGVLLGAVIASIWVGGLPAYQFAGEENRSITIVGVDKATGQGRLATLMVKLRQGTGRLMLEVPPWENEDTQQSFRDAKKAAEQWMISEMGQTLEQIDVVVSIQNIEEETTIAGPSASAAVAVLIVAAVNDNENMTPNQVRQDAVISAAINRNGRLEPVGGIEEKYEAVRNAGSFTLFIVAESQPGNLWDYQNISVGHVLNLRELADMVLW